MYKIDDKSPEYFAGVIAGMRSVEHTIPATHVVEFNFGYVEAHNQMHAAVKRLEMEAEEINKVIEDAEKLAKKVLGIVSPELSELFTSVFKK